MMQMAYLSFATRLFKRDVDENIEAVLQQARSHNKAHNITGQLIYRSGIFIQFLEGRNQDLYPLLGKILLDSSRHENLRILLKRQATERVFPDWSMAYRKIDDQSMDLVKSIVPWQRFMHASSDIDVAPQKIVHLFEELKA